jgi:3-keto-disaccharide hydrolase
MKHSHLALTLVLAVCLVSVASARPEAFMTVEEAGPDYQMQGEYVGELSGVPYGVQLVAFGNGTFVGVAYPGGLPGDGWDGGAKIVFEEIKAVDNVAKVPIPQAAGMATIKDGQINVQDKNGKTVGTFKRTERKSATLGAKSPEDAVVIFDGTSTDKLEKGEMEDGLLKQGIVTKDKFGDHTIHLEFRTPFMPTGLYQGRGNSGCYIQGRYELQILDSFGRNKRNNDAGGIYKIAAPKVNMCLPPLQWQTYDIDFTAPKFDANGKKIENARLTARLNGEVIHEDLELPNKTFGGIPGNEEATGPLFLQDHSDPVRFRNVWILPKKAEK